MENPKERIEDILKRNPYLDADITRCCQLFLWMNMTHHCSKRIRRGIGMR